MTVLPLGELIESFTLPLQSTKMPRGICPSTNNTAPCGYAVAYLMLSKACSALSGKSQKIRSVRSLHVMQLSTISIPYGESMNQPPEQPRFRLAFVDRFVRSPPATLGRTSASVSAGRKQFAVLRNTRQCDLPHMVWVIALPFQPATP